VKLQGRCIFDITGERRLLSEPSSRARYSYRPWRVARSRRASSK
jgi:hypothetical protein